MLWKVTEKMMQRVHLPDATGQSHTRGTTAISMIRMQSVEKQHMEQAVRTAILHRAVRQAAVLRQIVRAAVLILVRHLVATSQAVRAVSIMAAIRTILMIVVTMMSTWMVIMIRTGTTGMTIMQLAWMMPSKMIWKMAMKVTGKETI
jgi:hypothetical protein